MRAGCQVGTKADELLQGAPRVPPSEVLPLPDTPDTPYIYVIYICYIYMLYIYVIYICYIYMLYIYMLYIYVIYIHVQRSKRKFSLRKLNETSVSSNET